MVLFISLSTSPERGVFLLPAKDLILTKSSIGGKMEDQGPTSHRKKNRWKARQRTGEKRKIVGRINFSGTSGWAPPPVPR